MITDVKRWCLQPALLLLIILSLAACTQPAPERLTAPSPEPVEKPTSASFPTETVVVTSSPTPLPLVDFRGVEFVFDQEVHGPLGATQYHPPIPPGDISALPERLEIELDGRDKDRSPILFVYPVRQFSALSDEAAAEITQLRALLDERPQEVSADLPFLPLYESIESYHSNPKYLDFRNGSGISFLTRVDHDRSLATDETFFYTFQGLTDDDAYYVATIVPLQSDWHDEGEDNETEDETAERQAKAAFDNGGWFGRDLGDGRSLIDDIMASLHVAPDESFPVVKLPDLALSQGLFLSYDKSISGPAVVERNVALVDHPDGRRVFLENLPDMLTLFFGPFKNEHASAHMHVQPLRDDRGEMYSSIPAWQQEEVVALEQENIEDYNQVLATENAVDLQSISFQNGSGVRGLTPITNEDDGNGANSSTIEMYLFKGLSADGRYIIDFRHPLPQSMPRLNGINYLDSMVQSLLVAPDASTGSSMPINPEDCENEAMFVEDVSIPDYTVIDRGETFVKLWRIRNIGTCTWTPAYEIHYAQGNPTEWKNMGVNEIVPPGEETEVGITIVSPQNPGTYEAYWQLADESDQRFGDLLGILFEAPEPATEIPGYGVIEGEINYPANGNPAIDIYFLRTDGSERYTMRTEKGWTHYANTVPVGTYTVFARVAGDASDSGGGYTEAVICGLHANCKDHNLVEVVVEEGLASREINLYDWYAPAGSFPLPEAVEGEPQDS